jgi:ferredoxin
MPRRRRRISAAAPARTGLEVSTERPPRLRVNPTLCTGYGYCAEIVPELIEVDDWGYPIVDGRAIDADQLLRHARKAIATCPRQALLLEQSGRSEA